MLMALEQSWVGSRHALAWSRQGSSVTNLPTSLCISAAVTRDYLRSEVRGKSSRLLSSMLSPCHGGTNTHPLSTGLRASELGSALWLSGEAMACLALLSTLLEGKQHQIKPSHEVWPTPVPKPHACLVTSLCKPQGCSHKAIIYGAHLFPVPPPQARVLG